MNIAMLTTWNSSCGIAEYSRHLVEEFQNLGNNVLLLTNKAEGYLPSKVLIADVFGVYWWGESPKFNHDKAWRAMNEFEKLHGFIDALIVQYQSSLYESEGFNKFVAGVKCRKLIMLHDSSKNTKHNLDVFDVVMTHSFRPSVRRHQKFYSFMMPLVETVPTVFSFGMGGRNDYQFISDACHEIGVDFYHHDGREHGWWDEEKLFNEMGVADAIVLWYNEVGIEGQSSALNTAISSMRPVIVNDVGWFRTAPNFVRKVKTKDELQIALAEILHVEYIRRYSYVNCAKRYLEIINEA
jgi:hypothetical protein